MRIKHKLLIPAVLIVALFSIFTKFSRQGHDIIVIQSYYTDYSWANDLDKAVKQTFGGNPLFKVNYYYMGEYQRTSPEFLRKSGSMARKIIDATKPKIIICLDDNAQHEVGQYYIGDKEITVIFGGVNAKEGAYGYDATAKNVTGIYERIPFEGLKETINMIAASQGKTGELKAAHIGDTSDTVKKDDELINSFPNWGNIKLERPRLVSTFSDWKKEILSANQELDFIIISNYRTIRKYRDKSEEIISPDEIMSWTMNHATIPVIGVNPFVVKDGGGIAVAASPYEQGEVTARMAMEIALGKKAHEIPKQHTEQFVVGVNQTVLKKVNINLQQIYIAFSRLAKRFYK